MLQRSEIRARGSSHESATPGKDDELGGSENGDDGLEIHLLGAFRVKSSEVV